jgi:2-polyprenyl-3-methyl-5-hydroxy-6-metoxy-1,4-benzoquinol methylase
MEQDKAGTKYWDNLWEKRAPTRSINPSDKSMRNYVNSRFHLLFKEFFSKFASKEVKLLEIGCAGSQWLPYFAKEFKFQVTGLDYSEIGCLQASATLKNEGVEGKIVYADFFSPPDDLLGEFDIVVSFGVVEHFEETANAIYSMGRFLRPGGTMFIVIPNMTGAVGFIEKIINRPVYEIHKILLAEELKLMTAKAGLQIQYCSYFLATNFGVLNLSGLQSGKFIKLVKLLVMKTAVQISKLVWFLEKSTRPFPTSRWLSPYIICLAEKPVS